MFQCNPIKEGFNPTTVASQCSMRSYVNTIGLLAPHALIGLALLVLPIIWLWRLPHFERPQKLISSAIFALGALYVRVQTGRYYLFLSLCR